MNILLIGNGMDYKSLFTRLGEVTQVDAWIDGDWDLVVFIGGADVNPRLYGCDNRHPTTSFSDTVDKRDVYAYKKAQEQGCNMTGICRGAQFLNVMNGGSLIQHTTGHNNRTHDVDILLNFNIEKGMDSTISTNGDHHQMIVLAKNSLLLGWSSERLSNTYEGCEYPPHQEVEAFACVDGDSRIFGVQWHPEWHRFDEDGCGVYLDMVDQYLGE